MQQPIARTTLLEAIRVRLGESPVVALLGARQVGKTTLAEQVAGAWEGPTVIFDLEKTATREALSATPEKLLSEQVGLVIVDEVQRMPELFALLRPLCDDHGGDPAAGGRGQGDARQSGAHPGVCRAAPVV